MTQTQTNTNTQPARTYIQGTFATILLEDRRSITLQALSPSKVVIFEEIAKVTTNDWMRIFCGGWEKPIIYKSLSIDSVEHIIKKNALQDKLLYALGVWLTPRLPILWYEDSNWHESMGAWAVLSDNGKKINIARAIELVNGMAKTVGVKSDNSLPAHIPPLLFSHIDRMAKRKEVADRYLENYYQAKRLLKREIALDRLRRDDDCE